MRIKAKLKKLKAPSRIGNPLFVVTALSMKDSVCRKKTTSNPHKPIDEFFFHKKEKARIETPNTDPATKEAMLDL